AAQAALVGLVKAAAAMPSLAGIAFQDTLAPARPRGFYSDGHAELGYMPENRLVFLRKYGADPIDLDNLETGFSLSDEIVDLTLPEFDADDDDTTNPLVKAWDTMREGIDLNLLRTLWTAAKGTRADLPLFVRERKFGNLIASWTDPAKPSELRVGRDDNVESQTDAILLAGGAMVIRYVWLRKDAARWGSTIPDDAATLANAKGKGGVIFDLMDTPSPDGPLRDLDVIGEHISFGGVGGPTAH
ncbi:MAG TPA: hypothetical protein VFW40_08725, partial [Capsulimonadaceae bacterium]|nr:hypothetical protein [Capsulimonadaceae bacterium]